MPSAEAGGAGTVSVLFVVSELYPLVKTGGLADVTGALPPALRDHGIDAHCLIPGYPAVRDALLETREVLHLPGLFGGRARILAGRTTTGIEVLALDAPHLYAREGNPYLGPDRRDWPDNDLRFAALAWTAATLAKGALAGLRPEILHAHDWQAGLAPAYLTFAGGPRPPTIMTIHDLAYQGLFPADRLEALRLPRESLAVEGFEYYGQIGFLKAGLYYADRLTTVSPTYAREIQTPAQGLGLEGLLATRAHDLTGILNGIDLTLWDPRVDQHLIANYGVDNLAGKAVNKAALQARFGLEPRPDRPLFAVVSRLDPQKGIDLLLEALPVLLARGAQLAVLGSGDAALEHALLAAAAAHPGTVSSAIGFDERLSHLMQGGADVIVVPSRSEPCGLTQMYGLRYGTLPVVARVGGLADTVVDANLAALEDGIATGFVFEPVTSAALGRALDRALDLYAQPLRWQAVQRRAMTRDFGWHRSAGRYAALYRAMLNGKPLQIVA